VVVDRKINTISNMNEPQLCCGAHELEVHQEVPMRKVLAVVFAAAVLPVFTPATQAQNLDNIFRQASPSVVVVRSKG